MASKKTKTFECEAMSHDLFSTKFCKDGKVDTLSRTDYKEPPVICFAFDSYNMQANGMVFKTLNSAATDTDHIPVVGICYAIEGNTVDRVSAKNGKGWCEDVSPTLNTQDRHAICYGISRSCLKGENGSNGGMPVGENVMPAMTANGTGAVCHEK